MRGKKLFKIFQWIIYALARCIAILPIRVKYFLFDFFSIVPTIVGTGMRYVMLRALCKSIGENVYVGRFVVIKNAENLRIGNNVSIHDYSYIDALGFIDIGNDVSIAHNSSLISFDHSWEIDYVPIKYNELKLSPIIIESDVWIGCGCRILSGAKISKRTVVASSAVINKHFPPKVLIAGIPGKILREI